MAAWKHYSWKGFDATALTQVERLTIPADQQTALSEGFDPASTFMSVLAGEWAGHPSGSRVMMDDERLAIEERTEPVKPGIAFKASC
jgi:hypothetical protein